MRGGLLVTFGLAALGCGGRSDLLPGGQPGADEEGGAAAVGGNGGGIVPLDPEVECPLTCTTESCLPFVLVDDVPVGWHAVVDGIVYYTTAKPEGDNGLFRVGACGTEPELLLASDQFFGYGTVFKEDVFVTKDGPETVRLPKSGGAPTVIHSDVGDIMSVRGIAAIDTGEYRIFDLLRYHYDGGYGLYYQDDDGDWSSYINQLPDPDFLNLASEGFGFIPNLPSSTGRMGSAFGIYGGVSDVPVIGPLVGEEGWLYFTGESDIGGLQHYKVMDEQDTDTLPILGYTPGYILAVKDGTLFGATPRHDEHEGIVWHALPTDEDVHGIFRSGQFVQDLVATGQSLYVRTERRLVRVPKTCPGDAWTPCIELD